MSEIVDIDIKENYIQQLDGELLSILLKDKSSDRNIIWATDIYASKGEGYQPNDHMSVKSLTGRFGQVIRPRTNKSKKEQQIRVKDKAEVFTPSWICNQMVNHLDAEYFNRKDVFNIEDGETWHTTSEKIDFSTTEKTWQDYVKQKALEITCGEAPFLTSRYDTVTGEWIETNNRIGVLDRKLRIINENTNSKEEWLEWVLVAYKNVFGYEWQGDSLLIARENLLFTFIDYYEERFHEQPGTKLLIDIAKILAWNIWQMDGLKYVIPNSCHPEKKMQLTIFDDEEEEPCQGCKCGNNNLHTGIYCKVKNWETDHAIKFFKGEKKMKFDFIIGNPPYQAEKNGTSNTTLPLYYYFMDSSFSISDKVELITPARFLFNAGATPKEWNKKMLTDEHFKVLSYKDDARFVFPTTDIKGGVSITYRDMSKKYIPIGTYTIYSELNSILEKVKKTFTDKTIISSIFFVANKFNIQNLSKDYPNYANHERRMSSNVLEFDCFHEKENPNDTLVYGVIHNKRIGKYISNQYVDFSETNILKYKVILPKADGDGKFGDSLTKPEILFPKAGYTHTFYGLGNFSTLNEAKNLLSYIKTKFTRTLLSVCKVTQNINADTWQYVPLQDFTENSDIDWSKSIHEIDLQLYKKYNLSKEEIEFIESHVKEME